MNIKIACCKNMEDLETCSNIRKKVFYDEEQLPKELYIIDEMDLLETTKNFIVYYKGISVATVRYIEVDHETIKLQRMSVLKEFRRKGIAKQLLEYLEKYAYKNNYRNVIMDSAKEASKFYKNSGYKENSDVFFEEGLPHIKMYKSLEKI